MRESASGVQEWIIPDGIVKKHEIGMNILIMGKKAHLPENVY
jgi:hypothetical protein